MLTVQCSMTWNSIFYFILFSGVRLARDQWLLRLRKGLENSKDAVGS